MTELTTPLQAVFEMQRQTTEASKQLFEQGMEIQQDTTETFLQNSMDAQRSVQQQWTDLGRQMMKAPLDALESAGDETEATIRDSMHEQFENNADLTQQQLNAQFEQNAEFTQELLNAQFERGAEFVQELFDTQVDAIQSAFEMDAFDFGTMLDEQFEMVADSQDEAWEQFETEFLAALDEWNEQQMDLVSQSFENLTEANYDAEYRSIEVVNQTEESA